VDKIGRAVLTMLAFAGLASTGAVLPVPVDAGDPLYLPHRRGEPSALSPDPSGTADTAVPGEGLPQDEIDARIGWLILTYVVDARTALRREHVEEAAAKLARARPALRDLETRFAGRSHALSLPPSLSASLLRADGALAGHDRAGADSALADAERILQSALADLDAKLLPQSGPAR
jgi:hypothetical protein